MKVSDDIAAEAIGEQIDAMRRRAQQSGVAAFMARDARDSGARKDVNKQFLSSTIRSVDQHNRRHAEEKYWKLRELEDKLGRRELASSDKRRARRAEQERLYWAAKKAERTKQIWEKLHAADTRNVSVENAPAFGSEGDDSDDSDVKVRSSSSSESDDEGDKKHKKHKKHKKKHKHKSKKKSKSKRN